MITRCILLIDGKSVVCAWGMAAFQMAPTVHASALLWTVNCELKACTPYVVHCVSKRELFGIRWIIDDALAS